MDIFLQRRAQRCEGAHFYNTGLIFCKEEFVDAALSCEAHLITQISLQKTPQGLVAPEWEEENPHLLFDGK